MPVREDAFLNMPENADNTLSRSRRACVYTTLIGGYEKLNEQPIAATSSLPFICLTDDPTLQSSTWQPRQVERVFDMDPIRSQRILKLRPHHYLPGFDCSLYIDNTVILTASPERVIEQYLGTAGFSVAAHNERESVLDEFLKIVERGLDDQGRVFEQLNHYTIDCPEILQEKPYATCVLIRNHRDVKVRAMLEIWIAHVLRYSRRDQLSANLAFHLAGLKPDIIPIDIRESWFHSWPHGQARAKGGIRLPSNSQMPPGTRIRDMETSILGLQSQLGSEKKLNKALHRRAAQLEQKWRDEKQKRRDEESLRPLTRLRMSWPVRRGVAMVRAVAGLPQPRPQKTNPSGGDATTASSSSSVELHVDPADRRGKQLLAAGGTLNPNTHRMWQELLAHGGWTHIVDVGANYGEMLVKTALPPEADIFAFEPNPVVLRHLRKNLAQAGLRATVIASAVSNQTGTARLLVNRRWSGTTRLYDSETDQDTKAHDLLDVTTTTLATALGGVPAAIGMSALVKIDVEGHEVQVLQGIMDMLEPMNAFAALVEVLHLTPGDIRWIEDRFDIELYELASGSLVPLSPSKRLSESLGGGRFYANDIVLRRRP
jgi:FkbM family methyltransferase